MILSFQFIHAFFRMASSPTVMFDTRLLPHRIRTHTQSKNPPLPLTYQNYVRSEKGLAQFANGTNSTEWVCHASDQIIDLNILHCLLHSIHSHGRHYFFLLLLFAHRFVFSVFSNGLRAIFAKVLTTKNDYEMWKFTTHYDSNEFADEHYVDISLHCCTAHAIFSPPANYEQ